MKTSIHTAVLTVFVSNIALALPPALTIYNQDFAVVRDTVLLDLKPGVNEVRYAGVTAHLEPDSVILRDPAGKRSLQILEQNYRNDPVTQERLLSLFEGKTIPFENRSNGTLNRDIINGKVLRSGYVPNGGTEQPIIEVNGKLQFSLPGQPLFPDLGDDTILKPTLDWLLHSDQSGRCDAEVSYITGGFSWEANYNLVAPQSGDVVDLIGWITMNNQSGKSFEAARIKLMAGDVNKVRVTLSQFAMGGGGGGGGTQPVVSEKSFDEYHLYTLARPTNLRDRQMKQVEFVRATDVHAKVIYIYDGVAPDIRYFGGLNDDRNYGSQCNKKVWVAREFRNAETNHLGLPLPKGKVRFYRRNEDGQVEFTGENLIDHTPQNERIQVNTGDAFDLVGERKQTDFAMYVFNPPTGINPATGLPVASTAARTNTLPEAPWIAESFEIKLRNHKSTPVEIRVVEHLYRWSNWEITNNSDKLTRIDAQTIEFRPTVQPEEEKTLSYTVRYSW